MTEAEALVKRLNSMSASELEAERRRGQARTDAQDTERFGYAVTAELEGRKPVMTRYNEARADAAPQIKAVKHRDQTGREITEYRAEPGASMRQWMGQFMSPGFRQLGVFNGCNEQQAKEFRQRMQRKIAELGSR